MTDCYRLFSRGRSSVARHFNPIVGHHFGIRLNRNNLLTILGFYTDHHLLTLGTVCPNE